MTVFRSIVLGVSGGMILSVMADAYHVPFKVLFASYLLGGLVIWIHSINEQK